MNAGERKAFLAQAVAFHARTGCRVEHQSDFQAVLVRGKPVNHVLHLLLTLATCGIWAIGWLIVVVSGGEKRFSIHVDEYGHVLTS